ncbi:beta-N-acetylhexosaminidase [Mucilaginibacter hurinus]|uniref:beta-N-acetylhexosaminidase n=2 Tax=Mucilaginibacter hurinus TaxID=2201324 RepID=A0A367GLQ5_9SPHI|nr:beta-N-acetylhexosaminidase [Mucilaginibacter hurinus]
MAQTPEIIPQPVSLKTNTGYFKINANTKVVYGNHDINAGKIAKLLANLLHAPTGYKTPTRAQSFKSPPPSASVYLSTLANEPALGNEGYTLKVTPKQIVIKANQPKGLFYGIQTLLQLLPPSVEGKQKTILNWQVPAVDITDYPRFGWRGLMLDVSRHFQTKEMVKDYIDQLAKYKFNTFHWHLTDDNGWRIQINGMPKLTDIGAWRVPREGPFAFVTHADKEPGEKETYGGYYTQEEIREVVEYAKQRFVTVLPEIDVPAHSLALIASYPNLSCTGLQYNVDPGTAFALKKSNVLCVGNDSTYIVLDKIFTQVADLFPGEYIHMGGDEALKAFWEKCPKCQAVMAREKLKDTHELQSYFVKRIEKMLHAKGRKMIGWDEILEGGLAPDATVMSWRGMKGGTEAAKMGHKVIMTPYQYCYLDLYQGSQFIEPHAYGLVTLRNCYEFEPVPDSVDARYILGGQGNLWAESVPNQRHAEYMTWPRGMALAEVFWSPKIAKRDFDGFAKRVEAHFKRFDAADVKYATSIYDPLISIVPEITGTDTTLKIKLETQLAGLTTFYSFDTTNPDKYYPQYKGTPLTVPKGATQLRVINYRDNKPIGKQLAVKLKDLDKRL